MTTLLTNNIGAVNSLHWNRWMWSFEEAK